MNFDLPSLPLLLYDKVFFWNFPISPPSIVGWLVGWSVSQNFLKGRDVISFYAPVGTLVCLIKVRKDANNAVDVKADEWTDLC